MFRSDLRRTGVYEVKGVGRLRGVKWKFRTGRVVEAWFSSPAVSGGVVYVGSDDNHLYALDASTGALRWKFKTDDIIYSSPAVADGVVYVGSHDGHLYAVDARTGDERWRFKTGGRVYSSPAVEGGVVYFGGADTYLYASSLPSIHKHGGASPSIVNLRQGRRVEYGDDQIVYRGWGGTWATVVPEPPRPSVEVAEPAAESPVRPQVTAPAPLPTGARFEKRLPSRELGKLLFKWVNELDPYDPVNPINIACRVHGAIPLGGNQSHVWALRADGLVLRFKREEFAPPGESEEDAEVAYDMIAAGAERHPELSELLPPDRRND